MTAFAPRLRTHALGLLAAAAAALLLTWDLARPGFWLDESASVVATQRTWPNLWRLLEGQDAPLVPYYVLLKLAGEAQAATGVVWSPEVRFRLLSGVAGVLAVWALTVWLARRGPVLLVLSTVTALLVTGGFSRYGQEARPYAFTLLAAVLATIAWARMTLPTPTPTMITARARFPRAGRTVSGPNRRSPSGARALPSPGPPATRDEMARDEMAPGAQWPWVLVYAATVVLLVGAHLLAGSLIAAHLVAALTLPSTSHRGRGRAALRTALGAGLGLAVVAPFAVPAAGHGVGPTTTPIVDADHLLKAFVQLFTDVPGGPFLGIGVVLVLALLGLTQVIGPNADLARPAAAWALVPPAVLLPVVLLRPNLLISRYLVFVVPGWALLAGLGVLTVVTVARRLTRGPARARALVAGAAAVAVLAAMTLTQVATLQQVRSPGGHSEDIRPALAYADRPAYAQLPIYIPTVYSGLTLASYARADEHRIVGRPVQRDGTSIWPAPDPEYKAELRSHPRLIMLLRASTPDLCGARRTDTSTAAYTTRCMPKSLLKMGFRVESAEPAGYRWTFAVLTRPKAARPDRDDRPETR